MESFFLISEKKKSIAIKTEVKIPPLLPIILGQSTASTRPTQIYIYVGVSLLCFKYPATLKKITRNKMI